jgi:hypothetical protein
VSQTVVIPFRGSPDESVVLDALRNLAKVQGEGAVFLTVRMKPKPVGHGPGTELKKLLKKWLGIVATPDCPCNRHAEEMDRQELAHPGWCEENMDKIVGWLRTEAEKRKLPFIDAVGRRVVWWAISNARKRDNVT